MSEKIVVEVLREAKRLIETGGWVQGQYWLGERCCLSGAIKKAAGNTSACDYMPLEIDARAFVLQALDSDRLYTGIAEFNDKTNRTVTEILQLLDLAIERAACSGK